MPKKVIEKRVGGRAAALPEQRDRPHQPADRLHQRRLGGAG
jgi:hypothetical protein